MNLRFAICDLRVVRRIAGLGVLDVFFLTPTLSRWENRLPSLSKTCCWICRTVTRKTMVGQSLLALPAGEGGGEEERAESSRRVTLDAARKSYVANRKSAAASPTAP